jgi:hypothetical protein
MCSYNPAVQDVRFRVHGASISESVKGRLLFTWPGGSLEETIPASWFENGQRKSRTQVRYACHADGTFGFVPSENGNGTLVIDPNPSLTWATYYGGWHVESVVSGETRESLLSISGGLDG